MQALLLSETDLDSEEVMDASNPQQQLLMKVRVAEKAGTGGDGGGSGKGRHQECVILSDGSFSCVTTDDDDDNDDDDDDDDQKHQTATTTITDDSVTARVILTCTMPTTATADAAATTTTTTAEAATTIATSSSTSTSGMLYFPKAGVRILPTDRSAVLIQYADHHRRRDEDPYLDQHVTCPVVVMTTTTDETVASIATLEGVY